MASELQRRKTALVFAAMDVDFDGFLDQDDFAALAARWTVNRGLAPDSPQAQRLSAIMLGWWDVLLATSDTDRDEKVTLDEVLLVVDQLAADGRISREEFVTLWTEFWAGDNPNAAGTWVFGRFELPLQSV